MTEAEGEVEPIVRDGKNLTEDNRYQIVETSPKGRFSRVRVT
jgi:RNA:NAD 2'-phosphotransferase (TPT1/KptA family)